MDPVGLVMSIGTVIALLDGAADSFNDSKGTLGMIKTQMRILDSGVERIRDWMAENQPSSASTIVNSLQDALGAVDFTMKRLHHNLEELTAPNTRTEKVMGKAAADFFGKTKYAWSEAQMRKHLTDVRECVSLVHFTLTVCQLPSGSTSDAMRAEEVRLGANTISRAQKSRRQKHRTAIVTEQAHLSYNHSHDFQRFIGAVLTEEGEREKCAPDDEGYASDSDPASESHDGELGVAPLQIKKKHSTVLSPTPQSNENLSQVNSEFQSHRAIPRTDTFSLPQVVTSQTRSVSSLEEAQDHNPHGSLAARTNSSPYSVSSMHSDKSPTVPPVGVINGLLTLDKSDPVLNASRSSDLPPASPNSSQKHLSRKPLPTLPAQSTAAGSSSQVFAVDVAAEKQQRSAPQSPVDLSRTTMRRGDTDDLNLNEDHPPAYESYGSPVVPLSPSERALRPGTSDEFGTPYVVKAAQDNMIAMMQILLERGTDIDAQDRRTGRSAVMEAARLGREDIVDLLLRNRCRLDLVDASGNSAIHLAVEGGNKNTVKKLLASGQITVNVRGSNNRTPLHTAATFHDPEMIIFLLSNQADPSLKDDTQRTPLHVSASRGHAQICEVLLTQGAFIETYDHESKTPLQLAAESDHTEVVNLLLRRASTLKINDPSLLSGFYEAVKAGNVRMAESFVQQGIKIKKIKESWKPIAYAAQSGNIEMLNLMVDNKCSLKDKSPDGWTALHFAANHGHRGMVERLLDIKKLSWKSQTKKKSETALHLAIAARHEHVAEFLIKHKNADVSVKDADNQSPLHHAIRTGSVNIATLLMQEGAKTHDCNKYGWKPIHVAAAYGYPVLANLLLSQGVSTEEKLDSPNFKPTKQTHEAVRRGYVCEARWPFPGSRPLHLAVEFSRDDVIGILLSHGAKIDEKDFYGWRPLHQAAFTAAPGSVNMLLHRGANPQSTTNDGSTPLALGVRAVGLRGVSEEQKERTRELLRMAMTNRKKSHLSSIIGGLSFASNTANIRNKMWTAAEMAEALFAKGEGAGARVEEGEEIEDDDEPEEDDLPGYNGPPSEPYSQDIKRRTRSYGSLGEGSTSSAAPPALPPRTNSSTVELPGSRSPQELDTRMIQEMNSSAKTGR